LTNIHINFQDEGDVIQFFRFGPWHLSHPGPELDSWIATHVPHGIKPSARHLWRHVNAAQLNAQYARTLHVVGKCRLRRRAASRLVANLVHEGDAAVEWKRNGAADRHTRERKVEDEFLAHRKEMTHAARTLARVFANRSLLADRTAVLAFIKGMEERPIPDWPADEGGTLPMGIPTPFLNWKPPVSAAGENHRTADYLVELMQRLAEESEAASPGGYHRRRHGPFYYPSGIAPPRDGNDLLFNGLLYVSVRAARQATGAGRPIATETYGKKREHGSDPGDLGWKRLIPFRLRSELAIYCVQSWNARRNGRDIAAEAGVLHAANGGFNAGGDTACNTSVSAYLISAWPGWIRRLLQRPPRPITLRASRYRTFSRRWAF